MYSIQYLDIEENNEYEKIISKVLEKCFEVENLPTDKLIVSITLTTPEHIRTLNKQYRNIDKSTDVLSFPIFEKKEIEEMIKLNTWEYNDILGDMVVSIKQVELQAKDYGHSFERELSYMIVHSFYHLMGYDHIKEEDKIEMRPKEEFILNKLGITREKI